ncbi:MAG: F0F1 ATP synthase subunit B [Thermodesulfovibrionales bacterium]|nr:F0F1 ATP synthase subunit B [Thermodesulfovibrionales bacterium]
MKTRTIKRVKIVKSISFISVLFLQLLFLMSTPVFAGGGGEHGTSLMDWVWKIVNFGLLVFLLVKFVKKPLQDFLQQRKDTIEKTLKEAKEAKELAQKALAEVEQKLASKDKELAAIVEGAKESGELERARLIEDAEKMKVRIIEQAKMNIDYEVRKAKEAIQNEAAEAALIRAEEMIREGITEKDQERLFQESLKLLEGKN